MELKIDPEFAGKIPPLTEEEFRQLETNILEDGRILSPLIVWNGTIVDGHNRYRILQKHAELSFEVYEREFKDRYEAIIWICRNQLGRRNLTPAQRKYLIGKQYEAEKASVNGAERRNRDKSGRFQPVGQNGPLEEPLRTSERIAQEHGTGEHYVRRAERFAQGVDAAEETLPGIRQEIFTGAIKPPDSLVEAVSRASPEERKELVEQLKKPRRLPKKEAEDEPETDQTEDQTEGQAEAQWAEPEADQDAEPDASEYHPDYQITAAGIREIAARMASGPDRKPQIDTEFIILELDDALDSMMFRWDTCLGDYKKQAAAKDCRRQMQELAEKGIAYLSQYIEGRERKHVKH